MSRKNILFYYPSNKRSNSIETLLSELKNKNHNIFFLTTCPSGDLHTVLKSMNINVYDTVLPKNNAIIYYLKQIWRLVTFCSENKIDVVFSNLQHANFISVFAQKFSKAKFIIFRHHFKFNIFSNDVLDENKIEALFDKIINKLAKIIIVPSSGVVNGMLITEAVNKNKLKIIPYVYDFEKYEKPDKEAAAQIKNKYNCTLLLLMCSRLIEFKRHQIVFPIIKKLVQEQGLDIKLIVLDEGPEKDKLQDYITSNGLQNNIFILGFKQDFINYMFASDLLVHPSLTEASNSAVKEMGLLKKAVAVCSKVGDFDDYIIDRHNGFLMSPNNTADDLEKIILEAYTQKDLLIRIGHNLHTDVLFKFYKSERVIAQYEELL